MGWKQRTARIWGDLVMNPTERPAIETTYWAKPIPMRQFDWEAVRGGYDLGCLIGYGATEEEAVADLLTLEEEGF